MKKDTKIKIYALAAIALIAAIAGSYDLWARSNMVPVFPEERSAQEAQMQDSAAAGKFDKAPDFLLQRGTGRRYRFSVWKSL